MLWMDDSDRPFDQKVKEAMKYFRQKYGREATVCYIKPETLAIEGITDLPVIQGITLALRNNVLIDHLQLEAGDQLQPEAG